MGLFLLLAFALTAQAARGQSIGPLVFDGGRQSKAAPAERAAAVPPPSLGLSLPQPAAAVLPPLDAGELERLQPQGGQTPIGVHRSLPAGTAVVSFSGEAARTTVAGAWRTTAAGRLWRLQTTSPKAHALRFHFQDFDAGAGNVWIHAADGQVAGPYSGRGMYGDGDFWSGIVFGESATIEYLPDPATPPAEAVPFRIAAVSHIWGGPGRAGGGSPPAQAAEAKSEREAPPQKRIEKPAAAKMRSLSGAPLSSPKNAAATLTPGRPESFNLGPVTSPTLFTGPNSFRLEVPDNAAHVTVTVTADADVDLYVRFGEDIGLENGRPVSDHSSETTSDNERIVINRYSTPPLQAGTYFVSLVLYETGVTAKVRLTADVGMLEDCHPDVACHSEWSSSAAGVAQIVYEKSGGSFICSGTLLNNRQQDFTPYFLTAAHCLDTDAQARTVTAYWFYEEANLRRGDARSTARKHNQRREPAGHLGRLRKRRTGSPRRYDAAGAHQPVAGRRRVPGMGRRPSTARCAGERHSSSRERPVGILQAD